MKSYLSLLRHLLLILGNWKSAFCPIITLILIVLDGRAINPILTTKTVANLFKPSLSPHVSKSVVEGTGWMDTQFGHALCIANSDWPRRRKKGSGFCKIIFDPLRGYCYETEFTTPRVGLGRNILFHGPNVWYSSGLWHPSYAWKRSRSRETLGSIRRSIVHWIRWITIEGKRKQVNSGRKINEAIQRFKKQKDGVTFLLIFQASKWYLKFHKSGDSGFTMRLSARCEILYIEVISFTAEVKYWATQPTPLQNDETSTSRLVTPFVPRLMNRKAIPFDFIFWLVKTQ